MREGRASLTAEWVAGIRACAGALRGGYRGADDPIAKDLLSLPTRAVVEVAQRMPPSVALQVFDGVSRGLVANVILRTLRIDDAIAEATHLGARQLVIVGAGYDARAHRLESLRDAVVYEVDHPSTQREKRARLGARRPRAKDVVYVAVDFERTSLEDGLRGAGFDRTLRTVWVWEGVTMYLTPPARRATLATIGALSAKGSDLVMTYFRGSSLSALERLAAASAHVIGEPLHGMVETEELARELRDVGLEVLEDTNAVDWADRYWRKRAPVRAWERIAIARKG